MQENIIKRNGKTFHKTKEFSHIGYFDERKCVIKSLNPFPDREAFWRVYSRRHLKTVWQWEKMLIMITFSFFHDVFISIWLLYYHLKRWFKCLPRCLQRRVLPSYMNMKIWQLGKTIRTVYEAIFKNVSAMLRHFLKNLAVVTDILDLTSLYQLNIMLSRHFLCLEETRETILYLLK